MLQLNLQRLASERGIDKVYKYLKGLGFTHKVASYWANGRPRKIDLDYLETVCVALKCEPHDIIEWVPDGNMKDVPVSHPLKGLLPKPVIVDVKQVLNALPKDKLRELLEEVKRRGKAVPSSEC
jgi:DNA-binding Xre family transcriptional regulator